MGQPLIPPPPDVAGRGRSPGTEKRCAKGAPTKRYRHGKIKPSKKFKEDNIMTNKISTKTCEGRYRMPEEANEYIKSIYGHYFKAEELLQSSGFGEKQVIAVGADAMLLDNTHVELYFRDMEIGDGCWLMEEMTEYRVLDLEEAEKDLKGILQDLYEDYLEMTDIIYDLPDASDDDYPDVEEYFDEIREYGVCMPVYNYDEFVCCMDDMLCRIKKHFEEVIKYHVPDRK